jgi:hypothetical protein
MAGGHTVTPLRILAALFATVVGIEACRADCASLHALAQRHANDMARRNSLDHSGFMQHRGPAGAVAENVATGCDTEACARRMWMQSPQHRRNMTMGGCQAVASAASASGRRYWVMLIGSNAPAVARHAGVRMAKAGRKSDTKASARGAAQDGLVGRDFSIDGDNAP